jgi:hypothetical protein
LVSECNYQRKEPGIVRDDDGDDDNDDDDDDNNNNNQYNLTKVHGQYTLRYGVKNLNKNNINFNTKQLATINLYKGEYLW